MRLARRGCLCLEMGEHTATDHAQDMATPVPRPQVPGIEWSLGTERVMNLAAPEGPESLDTVKLDADLPTTTAGPDKTSSSDVDDLLASTPTTARGPQGTAAWLLRAAELGFLETNQANGALEDFKASSVVHTRETHANNEVQERTKHPGRYDHITKAAGRKTVPSARPAPTTGRRSGPRPSRPTSARSSMRPQPGSTVSGGGPRGATSAPVTSCR
jgi:hypothetical protein